MLFALVIHSEEDDTYFTGNRSENSSSKKLFPVVYYLKWNSRTIPCQLDIQILTNQRWVEPLPILIIDSNQQSLAALLVFATQAT